jgi:hypothetical protein
MTRRQPMTLQLQQQWCKDGEKNDASSLHLAISAQHEHDEPATIVPANIPPVSRTFPAAPDESDS